MCYLIIAYVPFRRKTCSLVGETQLLYYTKCIHIFTDILNTCENVNMELCTRFLSYNNYFCVQW